MVSWNFSLTQILLIALWPWGRISLQHKWVQGVFPGGKRGRCVRLTTLPPSCAVVMKSGNLNFLEPFGPLPACFTFFRYAWTRNLYKATITDITRNLYKATITDITRNLYKATITDITPDVFTDLVPVLCVELQQESYVTHPVVTDAEQEDITSGNQLRVDSTYLYKCTSLTASPSGHAV
jgi:hypothetical protein